MLSEFDGWEGVETIRIAASPEQVWSLVSVIARHPDLAGSREVRAIRMTGPAVVGATFEADITTWEHGSFMTRNVVTEATQPARLAWVSYPVLEPGRSEDYQVEVHWSFELMPDSTGGTALRHAYRTFLPKLGAEDLRAHVERTDRVATVRSGMKQTLRNVKAAAEEL